MMTNSGKEGRWDYSEGDDSEQYYDKSELDRARTKLDAEKELLDKTEDSRFPVKGGMDYQEGEERVIDEPRENMGTNELEDWQQRRYKEYEQDQKAEDYLEKIKYSMDMGGAKFQRGGEQEEEPVEKWDKDDDIGRNYAEPTGDDEPLDDDSYWQGRMEEAEKQVPLTSTGMAEEPWTNQADPTDEPWSNQGGERPAEEYDPSGEPDLMEKDEKKVGDYFDNLGEAPEDIDSEIFGKAEEYKMFPNEDLDSGDDKDEEDQTPFTTDVNKAIKRITSGEEESSISVAGPPAGTQPPANMFDDEEEEAPIGEAKLKDGYIQCPHCDQQFSNIQWLTDHIDETHEGSEAEFREEDHPRDGGKFTTKGGGDTGKKEGGGSKEDKMTEIWNDLDPAQRGGALEDIFPPTEEEKDKRWSLRSQHKNANTDFSELSSDVKEKLIDHYKERKELQDVDTGKKEEEDEDTTFEKSHSMQPGQVRVNRISGIKTQLDRITSDKGKAKAEKARKGKKVSDMSNKELRAYYIKVGGIESKQYANEVDYASMSDKELDDALYNADKYGMDEYEEDYLRDEVWARKSKKIIAYNQAQKEAGTNEPYVTNIGFESRKANEEQVSPDTYYYDYSDYWKKGGDYQRSGLALQAGISTDLADSEWDDLPADAQAKIRDAGYVTSYEATEGQGGTYGRSDFMLNPQHEDITTCVVCGRNIDDHSNPNTDYRGMSGTAPATDHYFLGGDQGGSDDKYDFESIATESEWRVHTLTHGEIPITLGEQGDEIDAVNAVNRMYFPEGFIPENEILSVVKIGESLHGYPLYGTETWTVEGEEEDVSLLSQLLDNELEEEEEGDDETEDIALITQLLAPESDFKEDEHPREDTGKFTSGGGDSGGKHSKTNTKDIIKSIKGGNKDWHAWGRTEKNEELYAELERRNREVPKPTSKLPDKVFRDDPDAVSKMEKKVKYWEDQKDYWTKIIKFPSRDYQTPNQLGDARWFMGTNISTNLRDANKKLEGIKAQQGRGTDLIRKPTYKDGKKRFYYSEEPKGEPAEEPWQKGGEGYSEITKILKKGEESYANEDARWVGDQDNPNRDLSDPNWISSAGWHAERSGGSYGNGGGGSEFKPLWKCPDCGEKFSGQGDFIMHLDEVHDYNHYSAVAMGNSSRYTSESKKKINEFEDSDRKVSPNSLQRYSEPIDLPNGKNALDQTWGVSEPETPDGQDLTGITIGEEEIIEKKFTPPKILYYKQYPFGRRAGKQNPFGEARAKEQVSLDVMDKAHIWWDNTHPMEQWSDMRIADRQRAIYAFLRDPDTSITEAKANEWMMDPQEDVDFPRIRELEDKVRDKTATLPEHNEIVDLLRDYVPMDDPDISLPYSTPESHPHYYESSDEGGPGSGRKSEGGSTMIITPKNLNDTKGYGVWGDASTDVLSKWMEDQKDNPEQADNYKEVQKELERRQGQEGGQGSGRKQEYASKTRPDKAHVGWKNYGIDDYLDKAEKDYEEGKEQFEDPTPWASLAHLAGTTVKDILFPEKSEEQGGAGGAGGAGAGGAGAGGNGAGAPTGNGGESPAVDGNGEDEEEPSRRRGFFGYGRYRNCPKGQVYKNGKCVADEDHSFAEMTDKELEELGDSESSPHQAEEETDDFDLSDWNPKTLKDKILGPSILPGADWVTKKITGEGGKGSGKKDHKGWMRAIEEEHTYDFCENCSMITEQVNHKCDMCGKQVE